MDIWIYRYLDTKYNIEGYSIILSENQDKQSLFLGCELIQMS